jgi:cyclin B
MPNRQPLLRNQDLNVHQQPGDVKKHVLNNRKRPAALQDQAKSNVDEPSTKLDSKRQRVDHTLPKIGPRFNYDTLNAKVPTAYSEFVADVYRYMKHEEGKYKVSNYVRQDYFNVQNRAILIDWLLKKYGEQSHARETFYLAVYIMDCFFAAHPNTPINRYQLVAVSSLYLACKYEEYFPPSFDELLDFSEGAFGKRDVFLMEMDLIRACGGKLGVPTSYSFLQRYARVTNASVHVKTLAQFYLELSLHCADFALDESRSKMAAAALMLAFRNKGVEGDWASRLEYYSGHQIGDIEALADRFGAHVMKFKDTFPACKNLMVKYSDPSYFKVAEDAFNL